MLDHDIEIEHLIYDFKIKTKKYTHPKKFQSMF